MKRVMLFLRGAVPLALVVVTLVGLPTLLTWWVMGGPFSWRHLLVGVVSGAALVGIGGLILGWAMGRFIRRKR